MDNSKIIIAGGTGLLGRSLARALKNKGYHVIIFTRNAGKASDTPPFASEIVEWDATSTGRWQSEIEGAKAIVNFAGANLGIRWTEDYKKKIYDSRINSTNAIVSAIMAADAPPEALINASAIGYYGDTGDKAVDETSPPGNDFIAKVCIDWEAAAMKASSKTRVVTPRMGVVLDRKEGALPNIALPFRFYAGGPIAGGEQWFSWLHIEDNIRLLIELIESDKFSGAINLTSPNPLKMKDLAKAVGSAMKSPSWFPVPEFALRLVLNEGADPLIRSFRVLPRRLTDMGYEFKFDKIEDALEDLLG